MNYSKECEEVMITFYDNLSEKDKRHYAAVETEKLGHGGITYISDMFNCARQTIYDGLDELKRKSLVEVGRSRQYGGGRKPLNVDDIDLNAAFLEVINCHIAGDPMDKEIRWVKLNQDEIVSVK